MRNILLVGLFLFVLSGCNDYLEEENKSNIEADKYYKTSAGYEALVNSTYASLREVYNQPWTFMAGTDMYVTGRNLQPEGLSEYKNLSTNDPNVTRLYVASYRAIQRCNAAIFYYDKTEKSTTLDNRLGEAKFLRAYYYFLLVQNFGGVSIVQDYYVNPPASKFKRNSAEEVYSFIIQEMNDALPLVPESAAQFGRVSKRAIKHFLSKVYLTRGYETFAASDDFAQAAKLADEAINNQKLTISFEDLFWPGKENNAEVLFSIQFDKASLKDVAVDGSNQNYWFGPYMGGEGAKNGYPNRSFTLIPTMYAYNLFTANDIRWEGTFMNVFYSRYYDFYDKAKSERSALNISFYYPQKWELADTAAWRAAAPARRAKTRIFPYSDAWVGSPGVGQDNGTPAIRKFDDPSSIFTTRPNIANSSRDIYLARLGETYLVAAEAYLKLGDLAKAADRINEVRKRAAKPGKEAAMMITPGDVNIDFILDERGRELMGEYQRWFDLKRTGKLVERTGLYNRDIKAKFPNGSAFQGADGSLKILRPIPQAAADLNQDDEFIQNPGY